MNHPKVNELDYINFLVATPKAYSCLEAGRVQPDGADTPAHDALTRLLHRLDPDPARLWAEACVGYRLHPPLYNGLRPILVPAYTPSKHRSPSLKEQEAHGVQ
ncbi:MAG: hypothetical protein M3R24_41750, partial [Chloroflexota bacterium]|nr:hypothetical protein [Chloroflexota bacterium]